MSGVDYGLRYNSGSGNYIGALLSSIEGHESKFVLHEFVGDEFVNFTYGDYRFESFQAYNADYQVSPALSPLS